MRVVGGNDILRLQKECTYIIHQLGLPYPMSISALSITRHQRHTWEHPLGWDFRMCVGNERDSRNDYRDSHSPSRTWAKFAQLNILTRCFFSRERSLNLMEVIYKSRNVQSKGVSF